MKTFTLAAIACGRLVSGACGESILLTPGESHVFSFDASARPQPPKEVETAAPSTNGKLHEDAQIQAVPEPSPLAFPVTAGAALDASDATTLLFENLQAFGTRLPVGNAALNVT